MCDNPIGVCFIPSVKAMRGHTLVSQFDGFTELFCSNCKCEWLSAARAQPHALCQYLPRGRQWPHGLAARRLFDLVEPTRSSSGESKQGPELACGPEMLYRTVQRARGHRASTCVQTLARKCPALTKAPGQHRSRAQQLDAIRAFFPCLETLRKNSRRHL